VDDRTACVYAAAEIRRIREVSHETNADRPAARGRSRREHDETGGSPLGMGLGPRRLRHRRADRRGAVATGLFLLLSGLLWLWLRLPRLRLRLRVPSLRLRIPGLCLWLRLSVPWVRRVVSGSLSRVCLPRVCSLSGGAASRYRPLALMIQVELLRST